MNKKPLIENACRELLEYGVWNSRAKCKYWVKRYLLRRETAGEDLIFWPTGLLAAGLWECREELLKEDSRKELLKEDSRKELLKEDSRKELLKVDSREELLKKSSRETGDGTTQAVGMIEDALAAYYGRWLKKGMPIMVIDDLLAGETLLHIYRAMDGKPQTDPWRESQTSPQGVSQTSSQGESQTSPWRVSRETVRAALDRLAVYGAGHPADAAGSFYYRPAHGSTAVFADGIGLACPFLYRYGESFEKTECRELAVRQIVNFLSYGMDVRTGLPYHGYDMTDGCKYGIIGWGRAVGWLLRGMAGCLLTDYGGQRLEAPYRELADAALAYQRSDGGFSWQLEALEGPMDTSATGMICAALRKGLAQGILVGEKYEKALDYGRRAVERSVRDGRVYNCSGECEGFSCYPQRYGAYPWALGPALEIL